MKIFVEVVTNKFLYLPILMWVFIQISKFIVDLIKNKKVNMKRLLGAGGMPSSHSACVTSMAVAIGKAQGFNSAIFAIATIFAIVVMYDAAGVRRAAGKQAAILNKIINTPNLSNVAVQEKLVELLGHTPFQVIVGAMLRNNSWVYIWIMSKTSKT